MSKVAGPVMFGCKCAASTAETGRLEVRRLARSSLNFACSEMLAGLEVSGAELSG